MLEGSVSEFLLRGFFNPESVNMHTHPPLFLTLSEQRALEWKEHLPGHWLSGTFGRSLPLCAQNSAYLSVGNWGSLCVPGSPDCSLSLSTPKSSVCRHLTVTQTHLYLFSPDLVFHIHTGNFVHPGPGPKTQDGEPLILLFPLCSSQPCATQPC